MFVIIKDRVQQQMLRASIDQRLDLLRNGALRSPKGHPIRHFGIAISIGKPRTQTAFSACAVIVNGEIDALRDRESGGVATRLIEKLLNPYDMLGKVRRAR